MIFVRITALSLICFGLHLTAQPVLHDRTVALNTVSLYPTITADAKGQFYTDVRVNGRNVKMLVDTGASVVALSYNDARKLRLLPKRDEFNVPVQTANGTTYAAPVMLDRVAVRSADVDDVQALILPKGATEKSLLGMSYLKELRSFQVRDGKLILRD